MVIKVVFANINHATIYKGEVADYDVFSAYSPSKYIEYFKSLKPHILCLAEAPFDNSLGDSQFIKDLESGLKMNSTPAYINDKSWIIEGKYYGTTILSSFPILSYESFHLPNPKLQTIAPNGANWIMHDKGAQKVVLDINGISTTVFNLHYFPVHRFNKRIDDNSLSGARKGLADILTSRVILNIL